eukprot:749277-Hanusia_phi.AAC.6
MLASKQTDDSFYLAYCLSWLGYKSSDTLSPTGVMEVEYQASKRIRSLMDESESVSILCRSANDNIYLIDEGFNMDRILQNRFRSDEPFVVFCKSNYSLVDKKFYYVYFGKNSSRLRTRPLSHCIRDFKQNISRDYTRFNNGLTYGDNAVVFPTQQFANMENLRFFVYYLNNRRRLSNVNALTIYSSLHQYIANSTVESVFLLMVFTRNSPGFQHV